MKKFYINVLALIVFLSLSIEQSALCAEGVDIKELKKVKNITTIFNKKPKNNAPKELKIKDIPADTSTFNTFQEDDDILFSNSKDEAGLVEASDKKTNKVKKAQPRTFFSFIHKNKKNKKSSDEILQEDTFEDEITTDEMEH